METKKKCSDKRKDSTKTRKETKQKVPVCSQTENQTNKQTNKQTHQQTTQTGRDRNTAPRLDPPVRTRALIRRETYGTGTATAVRVRLSSAIQPGATALAPLPHVGACAAPLRRRASHCAASPLRPSDAAPLSLRAAPPLSPSKGRYASALPSSPPARALRRHAIAPSARRPMTPRTCGALVCCAPACRH